jgi:hypothetical protein
MVFRKHSHQMLGQKPPALAAEIDCTPLHYCIVGTRLAYRFHDDASHPVPL